jgi:hypothetical protein
MKRLMTALLLAAGVAVSAQPALAGQKASKKAPVAKPAPAAKPTPAAAGFVASKETKTYHRADCKFAAKIKDANRVTFATAAEAAKAGYKPCKVCKPQ